LRSKTRATFHQQRHDAHGSWGGSRFRPSPRQSSSRHRCGASIDMTCHRTGHDADGKGCGSSSSCLASSSSRFVIVAILRTVKKRKRVCSVSILRDKHILATIEFDSTLAGGGMILQPGGRETTVCPSFAAASYTPVVALLHSLLHRRRHHHRRHRHHLRKKRFNCFPTMITAAFLPVLTR
jgi:hypothetical protein